MLKPFTIVLLPLALTFACSTDTEGPSDTLKGASTPKKAREPPDTGVSPPVAVAFDESVPAEVSKLLQDMIASAREDSTSGAKRGQLGMAYEANGYPEAALTSYQEAERLAPEEARWPYYSSLVLADQGKLDEALQVLARATDIDPSHAPAWMWRGTWSLAIGRAAEAGEAFAKAESLGFGWEAKALKARVLLQQNEAAKALAILEPLSRATPEPAVYVLLGRAYRNAGRLDDARAALARGEDAKRITWADAWEDEKAAYEVSFGARFLEAQRLIRDERPSEALDILEVLIEEQPANELLITTLSFAYASVGQTQSAFMVLRRALLEYPDYDTVHLSIAGFYEGRGDPDSALEHLDRAIELNPEVTEPYMRKGLLLQRLRDHEGALATFEAALVQDPRDHRLHFYAGDVHASMKRWPEAIAKLEHSVSLDPTFTLGHLNLALTLAQADRFAEAHEALDKAEELGTHDRDVGEVRRQVTTMEERAR